MMPSVVAAHGQKEISKEGLQLRLKSFYLLGFHTQELVLESMANINDNLAF